MKNPSKFITDLIVTVIIALLLAAVIEGVLLFIVGNLGTIGQSDWMWINTTGSVVAGLLVGYKLNALVADTKKKK